MNRELLFKQLGTLILLSVSLFLNAQNIPYQDFDQLLIKADQHKAASKQIFDEALQQLQNNRTQLSNEQKEFLDYLMIFNQAYDGRYDQAVEDFENLFNRVDSTFVKVRIQSSLSNLYAFNHNYRAVFTALQYVTTELPKLDDKELKHTIYLATANSYLLTDRFLLAREFSEILLKDNPNPFKRCRAMAYRQLADIKLNNIDTSEDKAVQDIIRFCQSQNQMAVSDLLALNWYEYQFKQLNEAASSESINQLIAAAENTCIDIDTKQFKSIIAGKEALLAQLYLAADDIRSAQDYAQSVVQDNNQLGNSEHIQKAYQVLETIARRENNFSLAYEYLSQRSDIERDLMTDSLDKQVAYASVQHDLMAKEIQLQQLSQTNELLKTQQALAAKESLNQKLIMAWLALMVGLLLFWVVRAIIKRRKLESLVEMDHLTKIYNRKGLEEHVGQLLIRKSGQGVPVHLAIMDLDHFKKVNDECGHLTGDWVLKFVVYHLKTNLPGGMMLGRLGGEEFAVIGHGFGIKTMLEHLELMRKRVKNLDYGESEQPISLSASFGVASSETAGYSMQMLLTQADLALYQAKRAGRDQVVVYQPDGTKIPTVPDGPDSEQ